MVFALLTLLCVLFAVAAYLLRDPLYRWMARQTNVRSCKPVSGIQPKAVLSK
jgi:hypothetical protein